MSDQEQFPNGQKPEELEVEPLKSTTRRYKSLPKLMLIISNISLSSFYFGYMIIYLSVIDFGVVMDIYGVQMDRADAQGLLTFCVPFGGFIGALCSSIKEVFLKICRNSILFINYLAFALGCLIFFVDFKIYMVLRVGQGICAGIYSALVPLIIKELAPTQLSGIFGVFPQLFITIGIFTACILTYILSLVKHDQTGNSFWDIVFGIPLITIALQTICLNTLFRFQTPVYLVSKGQDKDARQLLQKIYNEEHINQILTELKNQKSKNEKSMDVGDSQIDLQKGDSLKITKMVAIHLALLQQFVGISAVATYGRAIADGNLSNYKQILPSILNFEQVAASAFSSFLLSRFGRKTILQFGTIGSAVANFIIFIGFYISNDKPSLSVVLILMALFYYMINFNLSLGPIVWMYIPQIVKPSFLPYSTMVNWGASALSILLFPMIKARLPDQNPAFLFLFFAIWSTVSVFVNQKYVIETRNKAANQIEAQYRSLQEQK